MKRTSFTLPAIVALTLTALTAACGHRDTDTAATDEAAISNFAVSQTLKSTEANYRIVTEDGDTMYLHISTSLDWPERLGDADLTALRDSLLSYAYSDTTVTSPDKAMRDFVGNTRTLTELLQGRVTVSSVDEPPADKVVYSLSSDASIIELTPQTVTYAVENSGYLGGAHGETFSLPFTYDLDKGKVLTTQNLFLPNTADSVLTVVKSSLAAQLGVKPARLASAGIFVDQFTQLGAPYIKDNTLYIHYNQYDIAPYAAGAFDIPVNSVEVAKYLSPEAKVLLDYDY